MQALCPKTVNASDQHPVALNSLVSSTGLSQGVNVSWTNSCIRSMTEP